MALLRGDEILRASVHDVEWVVRFGSLAVRDRICQFIVNTVHEPNTSDANLFWCFEQQRVAWLGRSDVPELVLTRVEQWLGDLFRARASFERPTRAKRRRRFDSTRRSARKRD